MHSLVTTGPTQRVETRWSTTACVASAAWIAGSGRPGRPAMTTGQTGARTKVEQIYPRPFNPWYCDPLPALIGVARGSGLGTHAVPGDLDSNA